MYPIGWCTVDVKWLPQIPMNLLALQYNNHYCGYGYTNDCITNCNSIAYTKTNTNTLNTTQIRTLLLGGRQTPHQFQPYEQYMDIVGSYIACSHPYNVGIYNKNTSGQEEIIIIILEIYFVNSI